MFLLSGVYTAFNVQQGERRLVTWLLLHSFCMGLTLTFVDTAAYTFFLSRYESQLLPIAYIAASIVTVLIGLVFARLEMRISVMRLFTINLLLIFIASAGFWWLFSTTDAPWPALAAVIGFDVIWVLSNLEFWGLAGRVFNVRQGKRLFGLVGAGETIATIVGGATVPFLIRIVRTQDLLIIATIGAIGSLGLMRLIARRYLQTPTREQQQTLAKNERRPRELLRERYLQLIFLMSALTVTTLYFVDNAYYNQAQQQFTTDADLAAFLGLFLSITAFLQLFSRAVLSGWVLGRYGVRAGLMLLPTSLGIGSLLAILADVALGAGGWVFVCVVLTKALDKGLRYSLNRASVLVLYQPLAPGERLWTQSVSESIIEPIAGVIGGLVLLVLNTSFEFTSVQLLTAMLIILALWVVVVLLLNREYTVVLMQALNRRYLNGAELSFKDNESIVILRRTLRSAHPGEVIYALQMLEVAQHPDFFAALEELLGHPHPQVRAEALRKIEAHQIVSVQAILIDMLVREKELAIRNKVLQVLAALGASSVVIPYLDHPSLDLRQGAMVGLLKYAQGPHFSEAHSRLLLLAKSDSAMDRASSAVIIGEVARNELRMILRDLLQDEDVSVRRQALFSAAKLRHPSFVPLIIGQLTHHGGAIAAVNALAAYDKSIIPDLIRAYENPQLSREGRIRIIRVLARLHIEDVRLWLINHAHEEDELVRYHILDALRAIQYKAEREERAWVEAKLKDEVAEATWALAAIVDLQAHEPMAMLHRAVQQEYDLTCRRIFLLLGFIYNRSAIQTAQDNYNHASREKRAYAVEILDSTLQQDIKALVIPLFDVLRPERQLEALSAIFPQKRMTPEQRVQEICHSSTKTIHPWTKACALYIAAKLGNVEFSADVVSALNDADFVVQETALWALYQVARGLYRLYVKTLGQTTVGVDSTSVIAQIEREIRGEGRMLLTIEKVIILKTVSIFSETPDDLLAEIALILEEIELEAGTQFITKGDIGTCLYIIVNGRVRVHDQHKTIVHLGEREVVGELALLDSEPRHASVTTEDKTLLLKLDQEPFFELIANNPEVVRGIMRVLTRRLRAATV